MFTVLVWPLLAVKSIHCFSGRHLSAYLQGGVDTLYSFLRRQDVNWRALSSFVSKAVYDEMNLSSELAGSASGLGSALMIGGGAALSAVAVALLSKESGAMPLLLLMFACACASVLCALYVIRRARLAGDAA